MTEAATPITPFRRRTLITLIVVGVVSLAVALVLAVFADDFSDEPSADVNGYSLSSVGYLGLVEILRELDIPVIVSKHGSSARAGNGLLVVLAPDLEREGGAEHLRSLVEAAPRALVVLPRWDGAPDPDHPGWIEEQAERDAAEGAAILDAFDLEGRVERRDVRIAALPWGPTLIDTPQLLTRGEEFEELDPIVAASDFQGDLVGKTYLDEDTELWILSDPTPLMNGGLREPQNVRFAVAMIDELRAGGPVVFDETLHGYEEIPSLWKQLFRFPLILVSLHVLVCAALLFWAAVGRWGPARVVRPPPVSGKDFLIRHTADLLHVGGHDGDALRRYLATTIHEVRHKLHAPRELDPAGLRTWLERVRAERGGTVSIVDLEAEVWSTAGAKRGRAASKRIVELAARIHQWRTEMTHGPQHHP